MAIFSEETSKGGNKKYYYATLKGVKKGPAEVLFEIRTKEGSEYVTLPNKPNKVEGYITNLEFKQFEYEGKVKDKFAITLANGDDVMVTEFSMTNVARSVLNKLAGMDIIGKVSIKVFKNEAGFANVQILNDGNKVDHKYTKEFVDSKITIIKKRDGDERDYYDWDEFLKSTVCADIKKKLVPLDTIMPAADTIAEASDDSDLPF
jgi:hypothetical protein